MSVVEQQSKTQAISIPFIDLRTQQKKLRPQIDAAIKRVLDHGRYIMGPEVFELESELSAYCGVKHAITCSSGTDALLMVLMAQGIGPGDAVFIPSFTFTATPEVVALLGAIPVFVDVLPETYNIDSKSIENAIKVSKIQGLTPKGIVAVDLFGQPADYTSLQKIADEHKLWVMADAAQSFGATLHHQKVGSLAFATATSFFPAKPLGCYGDGGAVFTNDDQLAEILKSIRVHGKGIHKYDNIRIGLNARLDTIQASILLEKIKVFDEERRERQQIADAYNQSLQSCIKIPRLIRGATSAWAQYTIQCSSKKQRIAIKDQLHKIGVPTMIYYEKPLHLQTAYQSFPKANSLQVSETLAQTVLSLPLNKAVPIQDVQRTIIGEME